MPKEMQKTFLVLSNQESSHLAAEITSLMEADGYKSCHICDDPRVTVIVGLEQEVQLWPNHGRNALQWLRESVDGLSFGGSAIVFCPTYLSTDQLRLLDVENLDLPPDHGARQLVKVFYSSAELLGKLQEIPEDFVPWEDEE